MGCKSLILVAILGLFLVGCFSRSSDETVAPADSNGTLGSAVAEPTEVPPDVSTNVTVAADSPASTFPPTVVPSPLPTIAPTTAPAPTATPTIMPTTAPTATPTTMPTPVPTALPTALPTPGTLFAPTAEPDADATAEPVAVDESFAPGTRPANSGNGAATDGGTLTLLFQDPPTLDPHLAEDSISGVPINEIFGGLVTIEPFEFSVVPDLAKSWDISEDGTLYTFHLRADARFHDGKPVTAQDVKWSLERVTDPGTRSPVADTYLDDIVGVHEKLDGKSADVEGIKVIDEHTIEITIDAPKAYFLAKLSYSTGFVLDRANVEGNEDWLRNPNGTGPFRLAEYRVGEKIRLARNEHYHLGAPHLDEVEMILSDQSSLTLYENDEIQVRSLGSFNLEGIMDPGNSLNPQLKTYSAGFSTSYIGLNVNKPPLDDPKVRKALNLVLDRRTMADVLFGGAVGIGKTILPPGFPGYSPNLYPYRYNPERALQLLTESRYGNDLDNLPRLTLSISGGQGAAVSRDLRAILLTW